MPHDEVLTPDDSFWSLLTHARELLELGHVRAARLLVTRFVAGKRVEAERLPALAALYLCVRLYSHAERAMRRALDELGHTSDLLSSYALLLASLGRADESRHWLEQAYALDNENAEVVRNLAFAVHRTGARLFAYELLGKAHRLAPLSAELRLICGTLLELDGRLAEAASCYRDVVELCQIPAQLELANTRLATLRQGETGASFEEVIARLEEEGAAETVVANS